MTIPDEAVQAMPCPRCASENVYIEPDERGSGSQWVFPVHIGCNDCGINLTCNEAETVEDAVSHWNERALPLLTGVKVKGLKWELASGDHYAEGSGTHYNIYETRPDFWNCVTVKPGNVRLATNVSLETAKAAAQADYDARILSAIEVAPSPRAQALEEAARLADAQADKIDLTGMDRTRSITKYLAAQKVALLDAAAAIRALSSKPVAGRCKTVDELAEYLCAEFDFDLNPVHGASWPEHEKDEGKREGGYVRLQPSDVQAYGRENAKRILTFLGLPASPGASE